MRKELDEFFSQAKRVVLHPEERKECKTTVCTVLGLTDVRIDANQRLNVRMQNQFFVQTARAAALQPQEKAAVKQRLQEYMRMHPAGSVAKAEKRNGGWFFSILTHPLGSSLMPLTAGFLALVTIGSGSLAYAAESSLPGDWLYAFKVHVNENVRSGLALSEEERIQWEARRAQRRLEELEDLFAENRLPSETTQELIANFHVGSNKVRDRILMLRARGDTEKAEALELQFQSSIEAHQAVLNQLSQMEVAANLPLEEIVQQLTEKTTATTTLRGEAVQKGAPSTATPARMSRRAAVEQVRVARTRVRQMSSSMSSEEVRALEARVALMEKKLDEALETDESAVIGETLDMVRTILRDTTHAERMVQLEKKGLRSKR